MLISFSMVGYRGSMENLNIENYKTKTIMLMPKDVTMAINDATINISSVSELVSFVEKYNSVYDFSCSLNDSDFGGESFLDASKSYDENFFASNSLAMYFCIQGSSANYMPISCNINGNVTEVTIGIDKPFCTMDISYKLVFVTLSTPNVEINVVQGFK